MADRHGCATELGTVAGSFLHAARTWPDRDALVIGARRATYQHLLDQCVLRARGLLASGVARGDNVAC